MPEREEAGTVRSVERALAILDLLGQHQALGLEELHYPDRTAQGHGVAVLLHTLLEQGWLYRGLTDRRYRLRSTRLYGDAAERFRCQVERSAPLLVELSERTGLVADLSILDGDRLLVAESSVPGVLRKRLPGQPAGGRPARQPVPFGHGQGLPGRTGDSEVRRLARQHQVDEDPAAHPRAGPRPGLRRAYRGTHPVRLPFLIRAVALPVRAQGRLLGSVALHWPRDQDCVERGAAGTWEPWPIPSVSCSTRSTDAGVACSQAAGLRWRRTQREPACTS